MADGEGWASALSEGGFFGFERLGVYRLSVRLAKEVYSLTRRLPADERFGLTNQLRRAATSVTLNIAEGRGRGTDRDFARFLMQARGSLYEVVSALHLTAELDYLPAQDCKEAVTLAQTLASKLTAFAQKLNPS